MWFLVLPGPASSGHLWNCRFQALLHRFSHFKTWGCSLVWWHMNAAWNQSFAIKEDSKVHLTLSSDLTCANKVTLITDEDDGSLRLILPQEESQLGGTVETPPVGHWKHQDTHLTLQHRQVLRGRERVTELYLKNSVLFIVVSHLTPTHTSRNPSEILFPFDL